ncbi:MAG TPA: hypothetical protein VEX38_05365 [Fimbriimonadaceae bacterium]|nr:hypothetical protein [Fimbriimonadaceae bacterium]
MRFLGYVLQEWLNEREEEVDVDADARSSARLFAAVADYQSYLHALPSFPEELRTIAHPFLVDDALFVSAVYHGGKDQLKLTLRCGNIPDGYFDLILKYEGIEVSEHDRSELARVARGTKTAMRYSYDAFCHELDLVDGKLVHSFLFHGGWEWIATDHFEWVPPVMFTIRSKYLEWERAERADRKLPRIKDRFRVVSAKC